MYGKRWQPQGARPTPYSHLQHGQQDQPQQEQSHLGPEHRAALENLLQIIASRAESMTSEEIVALTDAFHAASGGEAASDPEAAAASWAAFTGQALPEPAATEAPRQWEVPSQPAGGEASWGAGEDLAPEYGTQRWTAAVEASDPLAFGGMAPSDAGHAMHREGHVMSLPQYQAGDFAHYEQQALAQSTDVVLPTFAEVIGETNAVKVSVRANVKSIAGAMSKSLRNHEMFVATQDGLDGINHGVKALCIARCYLAAEGLDLTAGVTECQRDDMSSTGRCYAFTVVRTPVPAKDAGPLCGAGVGRTEPSPRHVRPPSQQTDLKVAGHGEAATVAGAIAKCTRDGKEVILTAIGPAAVAKAVEAIAMARAYVRPNLMELVFYPGFETITMIGSGPNVGEQRCAVKMHVWAESMQS